jgi:UDP-glucose 4-epimerase
MVIGASGFVGRAVVDAAVARGRDVVAVARSGQSSVPCVSQSFDPGDLADLVDRTRPAMVVHAVGRASVADTEADPLGTSLDTVAPLRAVLSALARSRFDGRLVCLSSAAVYGEPRTQPVREDAPILPLSEYGRQRSECERFAEAFATSTGISTVAVRVFSLFGRRQRRLLVWELFSRAMTEPEIRIRGTGQEVRDFMEIDVFARNLLKLESAAIPGFHAVNIASGRGTSVLELATSIRAVSGIDKPIVCEGTTSLIDPQIWTADIGLFRQLVGDVEAPTLEEMLAKVYREWH